MEQALKMTRNDQNCDYSYRRLVLVHLFQWKHFEYESFYFKLKVNKARTLLSIKRIKSGLYSFLCLGMTGSRVHPVVVAEQFIFVYQRSIIFIQQIKKSFLSPSQIKALMTTGNCSPHLPGMK